MNSSHAAKPALATVDTCPRINMGFLIKDALGRSPYWIAAYTASDGRQLRKSTKCRDKRQARIVLQSLEAAELLGATSSATEDQIRALMHETIHRVTGRKTIDPTIADHIATWLKSEEETIAPSTLERYRQVLKAFESYLGARKHARLEALSKDVFLAYRDQLQADGHSPRNVNHLFKILRRPFKVAFDEGLIEHNPIGAIKRLRSQSAEKGIFTLTQISQLLAAAPDDEWRALIALGYYTGGRLGDLSRLTWAAIDQKQNTISFRQKKTGGDVLVPIHPELGHYLSKLPRGIGKAPLLRRLSTKSGSGKSGLSMAFKRVMTAAGIEAGVARQRVGAAGRSVSKLSFHALRHSFTSELARAGVAPEVRQLLTGHSDASSHKNYTHLELDTLTRAVTALPALP
jgi:integrase